MFSLPVNPVTHASSIVKSACVRLHGEWEVQVSPSHLTTRPSSSRPWKQTRGVWKGAPPHPSVHLHVMLTALGACFSG